MRTARLGAPLLVAASLALSACGATQAHHSAPAPKHRVQISGEAAKRAAARIQITPGAAPRIPTATGLCPAGLNVCVSTSHTLQVRGPGSTTDKLLRQLSRSNPTLTPLKLSCPSATHHYPFICNIDGTIGAGAAQADVSGTLRVLGIETVTDLYAYELNYQPIRD